MKRKNLVKSIIFMATASVVMTGCGLMRQPGDEIIDVEIASEPSSDSEAETTPAVEEEPVHHEMLGRTVYFGDDPVDIEYDIFAEGSMANSVSGQLAPAYSIIAGDDKFDIETCIYEQTTVSEVAGMLSEQSTNTPSIDIHDEGTYVMMTTESAVVYAFVTEGFMDDTVYAVLIYGTGGPMADVANSLSDSLLSSEITKAGGRTAYGKPVDSQAHSGEGSVGKIEPVIGKTPIDISMLGEPDYDSEFFSTFYEVKGGKWSTGELCVSKGTEFDNATSYSEKGTYLGKLEWQGYNWECYDYYFDGEPMYAVMINETDGVYNYIRWNTIQDKIPAGSLSAMEEYLDDVFGK